MNIDAKEIVSYLPQKDKQVDYYDYVRGLGLNARVFVSGTTLEIWPIDGGVLYVGLIDIGGEIAPFSD